MPFNSRTKFPKPVALGSAQPSIDNDAAKWNPTGPLWMDQPLDNQGLSSSSLSKEPLAKSRLPSQPSVSEQVESTEWDESSSAMPLKPPQGPPETTVFSNFVIKSAAGEIEDLLANQRFARIGIRLLEIRLYQNLKQPPTGNERLRILHGLKESLLRQLSNYHQENKDIRRQVIGEESRAAKILRQVVERTPNEEPMIWQRKKAEALELLQGRLKEVEDHLYDTGEDTADAQDKSLMLSLKEIQNLIFDIKSDTFNLERKLEKIKFEVEFKLVFDEADEFGSDDEYEC